MDSHFLLTPPPNHFPHRPFIQAHMTAMSLGRALGVSCTDLINANSLTIKEITHDLGDTVLIGAVSKGDGTAINHGNRQSLMVGTDLVSGHVVSPTSGSALNVTIPVRVETDEVRAVINKQGLSRAQHWHGEALKYQKEEALDHDVRLVKSGTASRVLIPADVSRDSSGATRFFHLNKDSDDYCDGLYADEDAKKVDIKGAQHYVVSEAHYADMKSALDENLRQKSNLSLTNGFKLNLDTGNVSAAGNAYVKLSVNRTPVADVMGEDFAGVMDKVVTSVDILRSAGEELPVELGTGLLTEDELLQKQIFGGDEDEEQDVSVALAALTPNAPISITSFGDDEEQ